MSDRSIMEINNSLQADTNEMKGKYLTFWVEGQLFCIPISAVVQIIGIQEITPVPEFPPYAKGIMNLRGSIIPLIDVRLRLGKEEAAYNDRTCIIVINLGSGAENFGLIVDRVDEVAYIDDGQISLPPRMGTDNTNKFLTGIARLISDEKQGEKIILCMDADKLLGKDSGVSLAEAAGL